MKYIEKSCIFIFRRFCQNLSHYFEYIYEKHLVDVLELNIFLFRRQQQNVNWWLKHKIEKKVCIGLTWNFRSSSSIQPLLDKERRRKKLRTYWEELNCSLKNNFNSRRRLNLMLCLKKEEKKISLKNKTKSAEKKMCQFVL